MILLLTAAGFYLFAQFSKELNDKNDRELIAAESEWIRYLETQVENGTTFILKSPDLAIYPVEAAVNDLPVVIDIFDYEEKINAKVDYRQLSQVVSVGGVTYRIMIKKSQQEKTAMVTDVTRIMLFVFAGLFASTLIFNWLMTKKLWRPFERSLRKIRSAELKKMEVVRFEHTNTREFNELNASLNYMTNRIYNDFVNMKEFTENAAHEMQTPLAVVQSKLELLLQDNNLTDDQVQSILQATTALTRLRNLNQNLLLLAKIENNQYETNLEISLGEVTKKYLRLFDEFVRDKQLIIETDFEKDFKIILHPLLADSLLSNLLGNAIKYNYKGGMVNIKTDRDSYRITNTSLNEPIPREKLFMRFNTSKEPGYSTNGLGLAIVKKIVDTNNLVITYAPETGKTAFLLRRI